MEKEQIRYVIATLGGQSSVKNTLAVNRDLNSVGIVYKKLNKVSPIVSHIRVGLRTQSLEVSFRY